MRSFYCFFLGLFFVFYDILKLWSVVVWRFGVFCIFRFER